MANEPTAAESTSSLLADSQYDPRAAALTLAITVLVAFAFFSYTSWGAQQLSPYLFALGLCVLLLVWPTLIVAALTLLAIFGNPRPVLRSREWWGFCAWAFFVVYLLGFLLTAAVLLVRS